MKSTFRILFYVKKDKQKANGNFPIMCRITIDGEASRFNTKVDINEGNWDGKSGRAIGRSAEVAKVNNLLDEVKATLHRLYHEIQRQEQVTAEGLKNEFLGHTENYETLLNLFEKHNENVKSLIGLSKSAATYQKYEVTRKHLANFIRSKFNLSDIAIRAINNMFINDFEVYLMTVGGCNHNTTAKFMQFFKRIVLIARNNGLLLNDPFANYKIRLQRVDRGYLAEEEIKKILELNLVSDRLEHVRDLFIFSCFCGLAYIDVAGLRKEHIRQSFDGNLWIMTKRVKTGVDVNVPLLDIPKMILDKYKDKLPDGKILPVISNQKLNSYLKEIADLCGIKKNLTFHLARHTFATTTTLGKGVPIETVSKMLGHTNIETTQIYARITNNKISDDMKGLSQQFTGIEKIYKKVAQ
ncbi:MAG: site-specific integrase [Sphingobacteriia bacterium]|nr:site-specific integrase [Sphingobacteriia bacterium]